MIYKMLIAKVHIADISVSIYLGTRSKFSGTTSVFAVNSSGTTGSLGLRMPSAAHPLATS